MKGINLDQHPRVPVFNVVITSQFGFSCQYLERQMYQIHTKLLTFWNIIFSNMSPGTSKNII